MGAPAGLGAVLSQAPHASARGHVAEPRRCGEMRLAREHTKVSAIPTSNRTDRNLLAS